MALVGRARRWFRSGIRTTARNVTATAEARSALVIAPHPADEVLGCGATIRRKLARGSRVTLLMVTDGERGRPASGAGPEGVDRRTATVPDGVHLGGVRPSAARRSEVAEAARRLGLRPTDVRWAGLRAGAVSEDEDALCGTIAGLLAEVEPDEVYVTCADEPLADHAAAGRAARRAVAAAGHPVDLLEYPVWLWGTWPLRRGALVRSTASAVGRAVRRRAVAVKVGTELTPKWHALHAYVGQLHRPRDLPVDRPWAGGLPSSVLTAAADRYEVFFPVPMVPAGTSGAAGGEDSPG